MKQTQFSVLFLIAAVLPSVHSASGQAINATMQTVSARGTTTRGAPAIAAKPIASGPVAPHIVARPAGFSPQRFSPYVPRTIAQPPANRPNYIVRTLNPTVASVMAQRDGSGQRAIIVDPAIRQTELRTLSAMHERRGFATENQTLATIDPQQRVATEDSATAPQPEMHESLKDTQAKKSHHKKDNIGFDQAFRRHWHEWHDRKWWHDHCDTIVFVTTGCYFLDGSYWYPAWGYDPLQSYYDYDGPIYTYGDLLPDEVIANVQTALQDTGYYYGQITGSLGVDTRAALANFQRDYGLPITGAIDEATVDALGLYQTGLVNTHTL